MANHPIHPSIVEYSSSESETEIEEAGSLLGDVSEQEDDSISLIELLREMPKHQLKKLLRSALVDKELPSNAVKSLKTTKVEFKIGAFTPDKFDGTDVRKAEIYIVDIKSMISQHQLSGQDDMCIQLFGSYLTSFAREWWNTLVTEESFESMKFNEVVDRFIKRFTSSTRVREADNAITTHQMNTHITQHLNSFLNKLQYYNSICEHNARILEAQAVDKFMKTLNEKYHDLFIPFNIPIVNTTVEQIGKELLLAEDKQKQMQLYREESIALHRAQVAQQYNKKRKRPEDDTTEHRKQPRTSDDIICNRCRQPGHKSIDCPQRRKPDSSSSPPVVCDFCNIRGHTSKECFRKHPELKGKAKFGAMVSGTQRSSSVPKPIRFRAQIKNQYQYVTVDSLCSLSVMTKSKADELRIAIEPDPNKTEFSLGDMRSMVAIGLSEPIELNIHNHLETIRFIVLDVCVESIILGQDWLTLHNPQIDFRTHHVEFNDQYCLKNCVDKKNLMMQLNNDKQFKAKKVIGLFQVPTGESEKQDYQLVAMVQSTNTDLQEDSRDFVLISPNTPNSNILAPMVMPGADEQSEDDTPLTAEELEALPEAYHDLISVFSKSSSEKLPCHRPYDISIELIEGSKPTWGPLYSLGDDELKVLKDYIEDSLQKGHIRPSNSPCGAPVLFVKKKDGSLRLCVDYRSLNTITKKDRYPLPLIDNLLDRFQGAKIFTALDLRGAYNLVRVKEGDEWKTAFRTRYGQFEYLVMPFGLTNAPAVFQRLMNQLFQPYLDIFVVIYLDDILVFSKDEKSHIEHVRKVLSILLENNLYCKFSKCEFHVSSVEFLGYVIGPNGIAMNTKKTEAIMNWKVPSTRTEVQSFIGFANYYRRFIRDFAKITKPMTQLSKKDVKFNWTDEAQKAFEELKFRFTTAPILVYPDLNKQFIVESDSSDFAIGCVLSQVAEDNLLHPIAFYSRKLNDTEMRWPIHDKELFGIISAFRQWRQYLKGAQETVIVHTDHRNLQYFMTKNLVNDRHIRWSMELSDYKFLINYVPGSKMGKADALSRQAEYLTKRKDRKLETQLLPDDVIDVSTAKESTQQAVLCALSVSPKHTLYNLIAQHTYTSQLWNDLVFNKQHVENYERFEIRNGLIYRDQKIFVPDVEVCKISVLQCLHDDPHYGHLGIEKTKQVVSREFFFHGMNAFIDHYVRSCDVCSRCKPKRHLPYGLLHPLPIPNRSWLSLSMDFLGPIPQSNGFNCILVVVDRLSKMAHFIPTNTTRTSEDVYKLFRDNIFRLHGYPESIVSDRDTLFVADFWDSLTKLFGITSLLSTAYHHETNGQAERVIQRLKEYFRMYISYMQDDWYDYLSLAEFAYNNTPHSSTGISPFKANYGFDFDLDITASTQHGSSANKAEDIVTTLHEVHEELKRCLEKAQVNQKKYADRLRMIMPEFKVGTKVWLKTTNLTTERPNKKLDYKFVGPYEIVEQVNEVSFRLKLPDSMKVHNVFHASLLEIHVENTINSREVPKPLPVVISDADGSKHEEHIVEKIIGKRTKRKRVEYLVHWNGYGINDRTWEPLYNLENCKDKIDEFEKRSKRKS